MQTKYYPPNRRRPPLTNIDPGMRPLITKCWDAGIDTSWCCDGHGGHAIFRGWQPYILFPDEESRVKAEKVLQGYSPYQDTKDEYFGLFWNADTPEITGTPSPPDEYIRTLGMTQSETNRRSDAIEELINCSTPWRDILYEIIDDNPVETQR